MLFHHLVVLKSRCQFKHAHTLKNWTFLEDLIVDFFDLRPEVVKVGAPVF